MRFNRLSKRGIGRSRRRSVSRRMTQQVKDLERIKEELNEVYSTLDLAATVAMEEDDEGEDSPMVYHFDEYTVTQETGYIYEPLEELIRHLGFYAGDDEVPELWTDMVESTKDLLDGYKEYLRDYRGYDHLTSVVIFQEGVKELEQFYRKVSRLYR